VFSSDADHPMGIVEPTHMADDRKILEASVLADATRIYSANQSALSPGAGRALLDLAKYEFALQSNFEYWTLRDLKANAAANDASDIEAAARAFFRSSPALRAEFPSEEIYLAYVKGDLGIRPSLWR
jgi:hypothetical protein